MIIDVHTHIFPRFFRKQRERFFQKEPAFKSLYHSSKSTLAGASDLLVAMDREGVQKSVVFGFPWQETDLFKQHNDYMTETPMDYEEEYPYGLRINLDKDSLKKLKLDVDEFEIDEPVVIMAKAEVKSLSKSDDASGERQDMSLQITDMDIKSVGGISLLNLKMAGKDYS